MSVQVYLVFICTKLPKIEQPFFGRIGKDIRRRIPSRSRIPRRFIPVQSLQVWIHDIIFLPLLADSGAWHETWVEWERKMTCNKDLWVESNWGSHSYVVSGTSQYRTHLCLKTLPKEASEGKLREACLTITTKLKLCQQTHHTPCQLAVEQ